MKINMTGDSWDILRGIVRDANAQTGGTGTNGATPPSSAAAHADENDDGEDDDEPMEPHDNVRRWQQYAKDLRTRNGRYRTERNTVRRDLAAEREARAADKAAHDAALAALKAEHEAALQNASKQGNAAADQRVINVEIRHALKAAGCKDAADTLKIIDASGIKINEAGDVSGVDEAVAALKTAKPYLFDGVSSSNSSSRTEPPARDGTGPKHVKDMTAEEAAAAEAAYLKTKPRW